MYYTLNPGLLPLPTLSSLSAAPLALLSVLLSHNGEAGRPVPNLTSDKGIRKDSTKGYDGVVLSLSTLQLAFVFALK